MKHITVRLPDWLYVETTEYASKRLQSTSAYVRELLLAASERREPTTLNTERLQPNTPPPAVVGGATTITSPVVGGATTTGGETTTDPGPWPDYVPETSCSREAYLKMDAVTRECMIRADGNWPLKP